MYILYFLIAFIATLIGSIIGMGGGIIIKPILDNISSYPVDQINFLTSCTVLAMAIVTTSINSKNKLKPFSCDSSFIIIGSIIGGYLGESSFDMLLMYLDNSEIVTKVQASILVIILVLVIVVNKVKFNFSIEKTGLNLIISGLLMGIISSFLGIGGGPINMAILLLGFNFPIKKAAMYSTVTILFTQISGLITLMLTVGISKFDKSMLIVMVPAAIIGGILGSKLTKFFSNTIISFIFTIVICGLILLNLSTIILG